MARKLPTIIETQNAAALAGHAFANPDEIEQGRYKVALGVPFDGRITYDVILKLVEVVAELDQRIEALENP